LKEVFEEKARLTPSSVTPFIVGKIGLLKTSWALTLCANLLV